MASYSTMNTIPAADVESETPLLQRDIKINAKTLVGGAAAAAFALGALGTVVGIMGSFVTREAIAAFIPASMQQIIVPSWWPIALGVTLGGALLGVIYPAWNASQQDALESLAYE